MIREVWSGPYGRPAGEALAAAVRDAKATGPLAPVTILVPSNFAGLAARRLLGGGIVGPGGIANVQFVTPFRLAELLTSDLSVERRPLTNPALGAAARKALADAPGRFAPVAGHEATEQAVTALYSELSHVTGPTLAAIQGAGGMGAEAVRLFRVIDQYLSGFDGEDQLASAAAGRPDLADAVRDLGGVVWYLPQPMTPALTRMVGAVLALADATVILGLSGSDAADAAVLDTCQRAGVDANRLAEVVPPAGSEIVSVTDADEEVRAVVRRVAGLAEDGARLDRIGIFYPAPDPYLSTLAQQLQDAGIPANGPTRQRLADSAAGRTLLAALSLPEQRWRRDRVMALVSGAPILHDGLPAHPASWEDVSRSAGVVQGLGDWRSKLPARRARIEARLAEVDDQDLAERMRWEVLDIDALGRFVGGLAESVDAVAGATGWTAKTEAALELIRNLLGTEARREAWPEAEQQAANRVEDALSRLSELDEIEPCPTHDVFRRALGAELEVTRGRNGRFGEGVVYGPLVGAVGHDLDAVFVLGLTEGQCPSPRRDDALLPDSARELAVNEELGTRTTRMHDQQRAFLAALAAAPPDRRILLYPRGDLRGGRHPLPSRWLLDTATSLAGRTVYSTDFPDLTGPVVDVVPSFASGVRAAAGAGAEPSGAPRAGAGVSGGAAAASLLDRDLGQVLGFVEGGGVAAVHPATSSIRQGLEAAGARRSPNFTEWDGNLGGLPVPSPASGHRLSATGLEAWAACGFRYFLAHVLGVRGRDDPERVIELSALDRGSVTHQVLERFFSQVIARGAPPPSEPWSATDRDLARRIAEEVFAEYRRRGLTGRDVHAEIQRHNLLSVIDGFLTADDAFRASEHARPVSVELPFGLDGAPAVDVELPDGRTIEFRGRVDRVDVTGNGHHVVNDYKTGKGSGYTRIAEGDPVQGGTTLQLGLYAEAARQLLGAASASAAYWMVNEDAGFARRGYRWDDERRQRFATVVAGIVRGIEAGVFGAVPGEWDSWRGTHANCRYCDFDNVCPHDRGESAEVKVAAPQMRVRDVLLVGEAAVDDG